MKTRNSKFSLALALSLLCLGMAGVSTGLWSGVVSATSTDGVPENPPDVEPAPRFQPEAAAMSYMQKRLPEGEDEIPVERYLEARDHLNRMPHYSTVRDQLLSTSVAERIEGDSAAWKELGPGNIGGRTRALVIHPAQPDTMYVAAADGGVWKT